MSGTDEAAQRVLTPEAAGDIMEGLRGLAPSARIADALAFWRIGGKLQQLKDGGVRDAEKQVSRQTGICGRELRYCATVHAAFSYGRLESLVNRGLRWSTIRVLAGNHLARHRGGLLERFESGRCSNAEVLAEAMALSRSVGGKRRASGSGEAELRRVATRLTAASGRLREDIAAACRLFADGAAFAPAATDGSMKPQTREQVRAMNRALEELAVDVATLLGQSGTLRDDPASPSQAGG